MLLKDPRRLNRQLDVLQRGGYRLLLLVLKLLLLQLLIKLLLLMLQLLIKLLLVLLAGLAEILGGTTGFARGGRLGGRALQLEILSEDGS